MGVWSVRHADDVIGKLEHDVFPSIGSLAMSQVKTSDCLTIIRKIEARGTLETAHRTRQILVSICGYALANEYTETNVAALTKGAIAPVRNTKHHPAITDPQELKGLLSAIDNYQGSFVVRCAMQLAPLVSVRPGELRQAEWSEIDFQAEQWEHPRRKDEDEASAYCTPITQAITILNEVKQLTGNSKFIFPNGRTFSKPLSENGITAALTAMGYHGKHSGHGWRAPSAQLATRFYSFGPIS